ncbi:MAG: hypothetical protein BWK76_05395 [Desulfobulbaceae bacterium A2]|nr:MAG: hypothetical protein BWK76_05395 [Desulfobulbaceae bacterium A2]
MTRELHSRRLRPACWPLLAITLAFFSVPAVAVTFDSIEQARLQPEQATRLELRGNDPELTHLPPGLGRLVHLQVLQIQCMEALEELPAEIGTLTALEQLVIDNGNGCTMNIALPETLGQLRQLKVLVLHGAIDPREGGPGDDVPPERIKSLPESLGQLEQLEVLNLARNGLDRVPAQIAGLKHLRVLRLEYNTLEEIPDFIGSLANLQELTLQSNRAGLSLPASLARLRGLRLDMGNSSLSVQQQHELRTRFPDIRFSFDNEYDDDAANEEASQP